MNCLLLTKKVYSILAKNCQLCQPRITNFVISYSPTCFISTASVNSLPKVKCVWNRNSASFRFNFNVKKLSMWIIIEDCRSLQQSMTVFLTDLLSPLNTKYDNVIERKNTLSYVCWQSVRYLVLRILHKSKTSPKIYHLK